MPRNLLSLGDDAVCQSVRVHGLFTRPAALRAVRSSGFGFSFGLHAPKEGARTDLFSAMRAFHWPANNPTTAYGTAGNQSSPLPKITP